MDAAPEAGGVLTPPFIEGARKSLSRSRSAGRAASPMRAANVPGATGAGQGPLIPGGRRERGKRKRAQHQGRVTWGGPDKTVPPVGTPGPTALGGLPQPPPAPAAPAVKAVASKPVIVKVPPAQKPKYRSVTDRSPTPGQKSDRGNRAPSPLPPTLPWGSDDPSLVRPPPGGKAEKGKGKGKAKGRGNNRRKGKAKGKGKAKA